MLLRLFVIDTVVLRRRLIWESIDAASDELRCVQTTNGATDAVWPADEVTGAIDLFLVSAGIVVSERAALQALSGRAPDAGFVLYDSSPNLAALIAGAELPLRGFLAFNHLAAEDFVPSLRTIAHGGAVIEPLMAQLMLHHLRTPPPGQRDLRPGPLTAREVEVMSFVSRGLSNKEIARHMALSLGTVRAHLRSIFRKLGVGSRAGAVAASIAPYEHAV